MLSVLTISFAPWNYFLRILFGYLSKTLNLLYCSLLSPPHRYEQLIDHTKGLSGRTYKLVNQLLEHAQAQTSR